MGAAPGGALDPDAAGQVEHLGADRDAAAGGHPRVRVCQGCGQRDGHAVDPSDRAQIVPGGEFVLARGSGRRDGQLVARPPADGRLGQPQLGVAGPQRGGGTDPGGLGGAVQPQVAGAGHPEPGVPLHHRHAAAAKASFVNGRKSQGVHGAVRRGQRQDAADLHGARGGEREAAPGREDQRAARLDHQGADRRVGVQQDTVGDPDGTPRPGDRTAPARRVGPAAARQVDRGGRGVDRSRGGPRVPGREPLGGRGEGRGRRRGRGRRDERAAGQLAAADRGRGGGDPEPDEHPAPADPAVRRRPSRHSAGRRLPVLPVVVHERSTPPRAVARPPS